MKFHVFIAICMASGSTKWTNLTVKPDMQSITCGLNHEFYMGLKSVYIYKLKLNTTYKTSHGINMSLHVYRVGILSQSSDDVDVPKGSIVYSLISIHAIIQTCIFCVSVKCRQSVLPSGS